MWGGGVGGCGELGLVLTPATPVPCSVLDLNAFERQNKAEGLGMVTEDGTSECLPHLTGHSPQPLLVGLG